MKRPDVTRLCLALALAAALTAAPGAAQAKYTATRTVGTFDLTIPSGAAQNFTGLENPEKPAQEPAAETPEPPAQEPAAETPEPPAQEPAAETPADSGAPEAAEPGPPDVSPPEDNGTEDPAPADALVPSVQPE